LVCIFLFGGNDSANMVLATDPDSWGRYQSARATGTSPIALAPPGTAPAPGGMGTLGAAALGGVLPITPRTLQPWPEGTTGTGARTFALHPLMPNLQQLFTQGHAAIVANVGSLLEPVTKAGYLNGSAKVPDSLFSHSDQQAFWQTAGAMQGWGGLMGDLLASSNPKEVFTAISLFGNAPFLAGNNLVGYQTSISGAVPILGLGQGTLFGSSAAPALFKTLITQPTLASPFEAAHASVVARSIASQGQLNAALQSVASLPDPPLVTDPVTGVAGGNPLALELQAVARQIAAGQSLGMTRQIFFVGHSTYDYHSNQNLGHPLLLASLDSALGYFYQTLGSLGGQDMTQQVTAFTMSEFGRCFISNGTGTDHGWGGHHVVLGGAVKGGDLYGTYPTVGVDLAGFENPGALPYTGAWIPTLALDQYAATLGAWLGLTPAQLLGILPNLGNFTSANRVGLGFL